VGDEVATKSLSAKYPRGVSNGCFALLSNAGHRLRVSIESRVWVSIVEQSSKVLLEFLEPNNEQGPWKKWVTIVGAQENIY
jgi:cell shape-determining protein MreC